MNFNLTRLRYLYEVVRCGSMRAASEDMNVAPSSVSRQIVILEEELGVAVLERGRGKAKLTDAGELVVAYYREDLARKEALASHMHEILGMRRGTVKIALGEGFVMDVLSSTINAYTGKYPEIKLEVQVAGTNQVLSLVEKDEVHIGMVFDCPVLPKISIQETFDLPLKAVMSPEHPLAKATSLSLQDLSEARVALPQRNFRIREVLDEAARDERVVLMPTLTSNSMLILKNTAKYSGGVTILPDISIMKERKKGELVSVPIKCKGLSNTSAGLVTRVGRLLPVAAQEFLQNLRYYFNQDWV